MASYLPEHGRNKRKISLAREMILVNHSLLTSSAGALLPSIASDVSFQSLTIAESALWRGRLSRRALTEAETRSFWRLTRRNISGHRWKKAALPGNRRGKKEECRGKNATPRHPQTQTYTILRSAIHRLGEEHGSR